MNMDLLLLLTLLILMGVLGMAELAIGASRTERLETLAHEGMEGARVVLKIRARPTRLVSSIQFLVTVMSMYSGAIGEGNWVPRVQAWIGAYAPGLAWANAWLPSALVVGTIAFASLVISDVVPKRIALSRPESVALATASLVTWVMRLTALVTVPAAAVSDLVLRLIRQGKIDEGNAVEDITARIRLARREGDLSRTEGALLGNVIRLDNRLVSAIMTPAARIVYLDPTRTDEDNLAVVQANHCSQFLVCSDGLANPKGFIRSKDILSSLIRGEPLALATRALEPVHFVQGLVALTGLFEYFQQQDISIALVRAERGHIEGLVTEGDLMHALAGNVLRQDDADDLIVQRDDGSWLLDGTLPVGVMCERLPIRLPEEESGTYQTVGGFVVFQLGRVPRKAASFELAGWLFEVVDTENGDVDQVLAKRKDPATPAVEPSRLGLLSRLSAWRSPSSPSDAVSAPPRAGPAHRSGSAASGID